MAMLHLFKKRNPHTFSGTKADADTRKTADLTKTKTKKKFKSAS